MLEFYVLVCLFLVTPIVFGACFHIARAIGYIQGPRTDATLTAEFKRPKTLFCLLIWLGIYLIILIYIARLIEPEAKPSISFYLFIFIPLATTFLGITTFKALETYEKYSIPFNILIAYVALHMSWEAGVHAESYISATTGISATETPSAIAGLAVLYLPVLWGLGMAWVFLGIYSLIGFGWVFTLKKSTTLKIKMNGTSSGLFF